LAPPLVEAGYAIHALDAPGYGRSSAVDADGYAPSRLAELAAGLLETLDLAPVVWIGFSWGGNIGVHTAARFPGSIRALGLLDSGYLRPEDDPDYDPATDFEDELAELRRLAAEGETWDAPPEVIAAAMVGSHREPVPSCYPALAGSGIPILLAYATEPPELEALRGPARERFRAGLPHARLVSIPGAGHGVLGDNASEVTRVLLAWLAELGQL
jgi:pimeloyl-ACP methyl ester carboxylesterase